LVNGTLNNKVSRRVINIIVPNHLNIFVPTVNKSKAIKPLLICQSLIADQLLSFALSIADSTHLPSFNSSRNLSYINIFASTHIHIANMIAAIPLRDIA
jgi:hypothetical protein